MRIIIAGSREFDDEVLLEEETLKIIWLLKDEGYNTSRENITIISGTARGADRLGEDFAKKYNLNLVKFPADWDRFGKSAGYRRNSDMAVYAAQDKEIGVLIAAWDGLSKGTGHMIDLANKHGLRVFIIKFNVEVVN